MRIVISAQGDTLEAPSSPVFGRCPTYIFVDTETMDFEAVPNPAMSQGGGAGIQAALFVVNQGAEAVLTGNLGPNAFDVLRAAAVPSYLVSEGTIRQVVEAFKAGQLQPVAGANVSAHAGMGGGMGFGMGRGSRMGRGMGMGMGRGMSMSMGMRSDTPPAPPAPPSELAELRDTLETLRQQLAETLERIEQLEQES
jgi:predicted Fe-Mo cluster-binding NifX family protein